MVEFPDLDTHTLRPGQVVLVTLFLRDFFDLCASPSTLRWSTFLTWPTTPYGWESRRTTRQVRQAGDIKIIMVGFVLFKISMRRCCTSLRESASLANGTCTSFRRALQSFSGPREAACFKAGYWSVVDAFITNGAGAFALVTTQGACVLSAGFETVAFGVLLKVFAPSFWSVDDWAEML